MLSGLLAVPAVLAHAILPSCHPPRLPGGPGLSSRRLCSSHQSSRIRRAAPLAVLSRGGSLLVTRCRPSGVPTVIQSLPCPLFVLLDSMCLPSPVFAVNYNFGIFDFLFSANVGTWALPWIPQFHAAGAGLIHHGCTHSSITTTGVADANRLPNAAEQLNMREELKMGWMRSYIAAIETLLAAATRQFCCLHR